MRHWGSIEQTWRNAEYATSRRSICETIANTRTEVGNIVEWYRRLERVKTNLTNRECQRATSGLASVGVLFGDTLVVIWKFTARRNCSEPPPERQAAGRYVQAGDSVLLNRNFGLERNKKTRNEQDN